MATSYMLAWKRKGCRVASRIITEDIDVIMAYTNALPPDAEDVHLTMSMPEAESEDAV